MEADRVNPMKGGQRTYTFGLKRESAECYEFVVEPPIPCYDSPGEAIEGGREFVEMLGKSSNLVRGPYTGFSLENVDVCAIDITALADILPSGTLEWPRYRGTVSRDKQLGIIRERLRPDLEGLLPHRD